MSNDFFEVVYKDYGTQKSFEASQINVSPLTLNAAARRGLLIKNGRKYNLTDKGIVFMTIVHIAEKDNDEYVHLKNPTDQFGMLCSIKGFDIMSCWDKPWEYGKETKIWSYKRNDWVELLWKTGGNNELS